MKICSLIVLTPLRAKYWKKVPILQKFSGNFIYALFIQLTYSDFTHSDPYYIFKLLTSHKFIIMHRINEHFENGRYT